LGVCGCYWSGLSECGGSRCPLRRFGQAQVCAQDRLFIAKTEIAMGCRGVGGEEVGVKCGCMQGSCEGARPGVRSWRSMVQVAASKKTKRVGAAARLLFFCLLLLES